MSKGFLIYAEGDKYVKQARALALSIKISQTTVTSVSLVTNDQVDNPEIFDNIIPIPWYDRPGSEFCAEHRWKLYHVSPYDETIVLDSDMLMLDDISLWWKHCGNFDIKFCSKIQNYKLEPVIDTVHRKAFIVNKLSSPYFALHYFKKTQAAYEFYKILEFVCNNWEWCWTQYAPKEYQKWLSMDLASAIAIEISGLQDQALDISGPLTFTHMKTPLQGWDHVPAKWQNTLTCMLDGRAKLYVDNIRQGPLFHYIEKDFITDNILKKLEECHGH